MRIGICDDVEKELRETESWCRRYFEETGQKAELFCSVCWEELKDKDLDLLLLDVETVSYTHLTLPTNSRV